MPVAIRSKRKLEASPHALWEILSQAGHLERVHPFCLSNTPLEWNETLPKSDELVYLNQLSYRREFVEWVPEKRFCLTIGKPQGKKSKVIWELTPKGEKTELSITVYPYRSQKISKVLYFLGVNFYIKFQLKKYLHSVLGGIDYYLRHQKPVPKKYFGTHAWFS
ncbi:MAG: SRPBCC family protein [Flavobacteriaceae bacterium]